MLFELGVNFLDESETNLRNQSTADAGAFADAAGLRAESGPASDPLFWVLLAIGGDGDRWPTGACSVAAPASARAAHEPAVVAVLFPELLLLIVPLLFVYFWRGRSSGARRRRARR